MTTFELARIELNDQEATTGLRHVAGHAARLVGFQGTDATKVATSVSELGRLAQTYLPAVLTICVEANPPVPSALVIEMTLDVERRPGGLLPGDAAYNAISRLMDQAEVGVDRVVISKLLPQALPQGQLPAIREQLLLRSPNDLRAALQAQNEELATILIDLRERETELVRVNTELEQTNRGVVALYAELEERANEVRIAQRVVFEELEGALRPPPPAVAGLELGIRYLPADVNTPTGGDLYDWFVMPDGSVHITVVDVQGHGVKSTRDALLVTHAVRTLSLEGHLPGQLVARTDSLLQTAGSTVVATALIARIDPVSGVLDLAGAGHPPALRLTGAEPVYLEAPGRPLGYPGAGSNYLARYALDPGDLLLLYTDGLVEIRRDIIEGMETLQTAAVKARGLRMPQLLDTVLAACTQGDPLGDDTLLLAVRRLP